MICSNNINNRFSIYSHNVRSLNGKINLLADLQSKFDIPFTIIALQEIWYVGSELSLPGYQPLDYISHDKDARFKHPNCGGGIGFCYNFIVHIM